MYYVLTHSNVMHFCSNGSYFKMLNCNCGNVWVLKHTLQKAVIIIEVAVQYDNGINVVGTIILAVSKQNPDLTTMYSENTLF